MGTDPLERHHDYDVLIEEAGVALRGTFFIDKSMKPTQERPLEYIG